MHQKLHELSNRQSPLDPRQWRQRWSPDPGKAQAMMVWSQAVEITVMFLNPMFLNTNPTKQLWRKQGPTDSDHFLFFSPVNCEPFLQPFALVPKRPARPTRCRYESPLSGPFFCVLRWSNWWLFLFPLSCLFFGLCLVGCLLFPQTAIIWGLCWCNLFLLFCCLLVVCLLFVWNQCPSHPGLSSGMS